MAQKIVFRRLQDIPPIAVSTATIVWNKTGTWRYLKPKYVRKPLPAMKPALLGTTLKALWS